MAELVGLLMVGEVGEGSEARTIDCTSDLLSSVGLPNACFVQEASLMVSLMLSTMCSVVGDANNPALADSSRSFLSGTGDRTSHALGRRDMDATIMCVTLCGPALGTRA